MTQVLYTHMPSLSRLLPTLSALVKARYHQPWSSFSACWAPLPPGALSTLNHPETQLRQACKGSCFRPQSSS